MAVTLAQAVAIAKSYEGTVGVLIPEVKYGPLGSDADRVFEFRGSHEISPLETGNTNVFAVREGSGRVEMGSCPTWYLLDDHIVFDFEGNVIRSREQVQRDYQEQEAEQNVIEDNEVDDEIVMPVPVVSPGS